MNIYKLDKKQLAQMEKDFKKTAYGKEQFYLSYSFSIIGLALTIMLAVIYLIFNKRCLSCCCGYYYSYYFYAAFAIPICLLLAISIFAYIFGRIKFVKELRKYAERLDETK